MKTISRYIMTLALLITAVTGAWAEEPKVYTSAVATTDLKVGDILAEGFSVTTTNPLGAAFTLEGGRVKRNGEIRTNGYGIELRIITAYGANASFQTTDGTYTPVDENGNDGNAWLVTSIGTVVGMDFVKLAGITIEPPLTVAWDASTKTGTFKMPGSDVVLTPIYANAAAFATTGTESEANLPAAAEGVIAGTDAPLIADGTGIVAFAGESTTVTQGTLMYAIGNSATQAPALTAFGPTVPTAENVADDGGDVYVWYYIQGADAPQGEAATLDNTFSDTEPACLTVQVLTNKFDITLNAANANTIEAGKATVTVAGAAATVTDGKLQGVKMGSEVKLKAATGYKFRKVEVKKGGAATLATALENGATVVIAFKYRDDGTCTFTNNNGTFTFVSGTGQLGGGNGPKQLSVENGKLIFKGSGTNSFTDRWSWYGFQVTFDPTANTYEVWKGSDLDVASFTSISVNGTDITDQLSELK